eukprot:11326486-Heterocapsa_arctica.AAC.1
MSDMFTDPDDEYMPTMADDEGDDFYHRNAPEAEAPADEAVCPEGEVAALRGSADGEPLALAPQE